MKESFKEFVLSETIPTGAAGVTPATPNRVGDPDDRKKVQLAQDAKMQLNKAKSTMTNPSASMKDRKEVLNKLKQTKSKLNNLAMQDAIGDIENQLKQISPNTQIGGTQQPSTPPGAI